MNDNSELVPRAQAYEIYWKFVAERQKIFERRLRHETPPWTADPILASYKFCNVFRAADRVSQYMIREICYGGATGENLAFQIVAFRTFSKIETWDYLAEKLGHQPGIEDLRNGQFEHFLTELKRSGAKLYTGAFILCANDAYGRRLKHLNRVEMFKRMFLSGDLYDKIANAKSLARFTINFTLIR